MRTPAVGQDAPKIFSYEYYERLYHLEQEHWWQLGMRAIAGHLLDPRLRGRQRLRILDAGCGTGSMLTWLERYAGPSDIVGIDLSRYALNFCRQRGLEQLAQGSILQLPFNAGRFDLVLCLDILQHLPRDGSDRWALQECRRVLAPGGLFYLRTNVHRGPVRPSTQPVSPPAKAADYHRYTQEEMIDMLIETGFTPRRVSYANMLPALASSWMDRMKPRRAEHHGHGHDHGLAVRVPPFGINTALKLVTRAEARYLAGAHRRLPFGHSQVALAEATGGPAAHGGNVENGEVRRPPATEMQDGRAWRGSSTSETGS